MPTILLVAMALAGAVLNILKRWQGFALWLVADVGLAYVNFARLEDAQGVLWCAYAGLAYWGMRSWLMQSAEGKGEGR